MKNEVYQLLNKLHIQHDKIEHPPAMKKFMYAKKKMEPLLI